jgi:hypothetical protein
MKWITEIDGKRITPQQVDEDDFAPDVVTGELLVALFGHWYAVCRVTIEIEIEAPAEWIDV